WNVRDSDGTLIICHGRPTGGTAWTALCAKSLKKPLYIAATPRMRSAAKVRAWLAAERIRTLNVAGPRASDWPEGYERAYRLLAAVLDTPEDLLVSTMKGVLCQHDMFPRKKET
ncbi:MAG: putative molybdenum carrier protein, partial [Bacteroidota bacterium]|nr:putative molybdenum carrier protein [Bacteroidota bacterium]